MSDNETTWDGSHPALGSEQGASITVLLTVEDASKLRLSPSEILRVLREQLGLDRDISSEHPTKQHYVATIQRNNRDGHYQRVTVESRDGRGPWSEEVSDKHKEINWDEVW